MNHTKENLKKIIDEKDRDIYYQYRLLNKPGHGLAKELGLSYTKVLSAVRRAEQDIQGIQRVSYTERYLYTGKRYPSVKGKRITMTHAARLCGRGSDFIRSRMSQGYSFSEVLDKQEAIKSKKQSWMELDIAEAKMELHVKLNKLPFCRWGEAS